MPAPPPQSLSETLHHIPPLADTSPGARRRWPLIITQMPRITSFGINKLPRLAAKIIKLSS